MDAASSNYLNLGSPSYFNVALQPVVRRSEEPATDRRQSSVELPAESGAP